jgi:hypothetical protein
MTPRAGVRAGAAAAVVWALVLAVFGLLGGALDPLSQDTELLVLVIVSSFLGAAVGTSVGAWQARSAGAWAPGLGLLIPAVVVVVLGVLLTASGGGTADEGDTGLIYAAFPLGAAVGAVVYGRRWLADSR